jgi:hypothetical protein
MMESCSAKLLDNCSIEKKTPEGIRINLGVIVSTYT